MSTLKGPLSFLFIYNDLQLCKALTDLVIKKYGEKVETVYCTDKVEGLKLYEESFWDIVVTETDLPKKDNALVFDLGKFLYTFTFSED